MKLKWPIYVAIVVPLLAFAASTPKQDFAKVIASTPDAEHGAKLFENCVSCHGADGAGAVSGSVPRISGQHYRVLVRQIVDFRHGKRWDYRMEGVATGHKVLPGLQDIADVAWYVSELNRDGARGVGDGQNVQRGAAIFAAKCATCHGANADGDGTRDIPKLSGQHAGYISRQIYDAVDGRRPPLSRSHGKQFEPLEFAEVLGLADYLSRIGWHDDPSGILQTPPPGSH